jgi:hypothetical protein
VFYVQVTVHRDKLRTNNQIDASNIQNKFWTFDASSWLFVRSLSRMCVTMHGSQNAKFKIFLAAYFQKHFCPLLTGIQLPLHNPKL